MINSVPNAAKIPDKVCIVSYDDLSCSVQNVMFTNDIINPPYGTLIIKDNIFTGPFYITKILQFGANKFYVNLTIENALPSTENIKLVTKLRHWTLNEILMQGLICKGGKLENSVEMVAVTYNQYSTMILKDGEIYNKIMEI